MDIRNCFPKKRKQVAHAENTSPGMLEIIDFLDIKNTYRAALTSCHSREPFLVMTNSIMNNALSSFRLSKNQHDTICIKVHTQIKEVRNLYAWVRDTPYGCLLGDRELCRKLVSCCAHVFCKPLDELTIYAELMFSRMTEKLDPDDLTKSLFGTPYRKHLSIAKVLSFWELTNRPKCSEDEVFATAFLMLLTENFQVNLTWANSWKGHRNELWVEDMAWILQKDFKLVLSDTYRLYAPIREWLARCRAKPDWLFLKTKQIDDSVYLEDWYQIETDLVSVVSDYITDAKRPDEKESVYVHPKSMEDCCICMEKLQYREAKRLQCAHVFHLGCITDWYATSQTCPLCRAIQKLNSASSLGDWDEWLSGEAHSRWNTQQKEAMRNAVRNKCTVVTGAGGTGKTEIATVLGRFAISNIDDEEYVQRSVFIAPTGKAAVTLQNRLRSDGLDKHFQIRTIHSWIYKSHYKPQPSKVIPFLFVDESSMINLWLMWHLLQCALTNGVQRIVFFGDPLQLPPVENHGTLLHALVSWRGCGLVYELTHNYRAQEAPAMIELMAYLRQSMLVPRKLDEQRFKNKPMLDIHTVSTQELFPCLLSVLKTFDPKKTRVLCAVKDPLLLTDSDIPEQNQRSLVQIHQYFNHQPMRTSHSRFLPGDIVMSTMNITNEKDDSILVCNGSEGEALGRGCFKFDDYTIQDGGKNDKERNLIKTMMRGTMSTVHKFQGSEMDTIIAVFNGRNHKHYTMELLYTACSRARKRLVCIFEKQTAAFYFDQEPRRVVRNHQFNKALREKATH